MHLRSYHSLVLNDQPPTWDRVTDHPWGNFSLLCNVIHVLKPPVEGSLMYEKRQTLNHCRIFQVGYRDCECGPLEGCWVREAVLTWPGERAKTKLFSKCCSQKCLETFREIISHSLHPAVARETWLCIVSVNKQDYVRDSWTCHQNVLLNQIKWIVLVTLIKKG